MPFIRKIPLNIPASGTYNGPPLYLPHSFSMLNVQMFYNVSGTANPISTEVHHSLDNVNFSEFLDIDNKPMVGYFEAQRNISCWNFRNIYSPFIRLKFIFPENMAGTVSHIIINTN